MYKKNKLAAILQQNRDLFHTQDLGLIWNISNKNTLYTTISRYKKRGILYAIHKGFYATKSIDSLHPWALGTKATHRFAYVSCETILSQKGIVNFIPSQITIIGHYSKSFEIGGHCFRLRQLNDAYLYNAAGIVYTENFAYATLERAIADLLYFNPAMHFDAPIDWKVIRQVQSDIGYPRTNR